MESTIDIINRLVRIEAIKPRLYAVCLNDVAVGTRINKTAAEQFARAVKDEIRKAFGVPDDVWERHGG